MTEINRHGLSRTISESVKRAVRHHCGFGCAHCGRALVQYHHFDPPFENAQEHREDGIVLLCPNCHIKFGSMPPEQMRRIWDAPRCKRDGFTRDDFLFRFDQVPNVKLGNIVARSGQILRHGSRVILGLTESEEEEGPLRFTCELVDNRNVLMLAILNNELSVGVDHFDVELETKRLRIRRKVGDIVLDMTTNRLDEVHITHLESSLAGGRIHCSPHHGCTVQSPLGGRVSVSGIISGDIGIWINDDNLCLIAASLSGAAGVAQRWA
jgi:hypothetical protein